WIGGDLDGAVDVLPFTAVDGELAREGGGEGDVVPALLCIGRGDDLGGVRLAGIGGGDRVPVAEVPVVGDRGGSDRDRGAEQLRAEQLVVGLGVEHIDYVHREPALCRSGVRLERL